MPKPKIVVFWGKPVGPMVGRYACPFANIGPKYPVYQSLFDILLESAEVYAVVGYENYIAPMTFKESHLYLGDGKFEKISKTIVADSVYDRSAKMSYPGDSGLENQKIINSSKFKIFSNNKWELYKKFPEYCPKTLFAENQMELKKILRGLNSSQLYVIKPFNGYKGKGIEFGTPEDLSEYNFEKPVVIQEFKETKDGIPGLVVGRHDLRVAIVDGDIVWATIRQPKGDNMLANVAQGGSINEICIDELPKSILPIVENLSRHFKEHYYNPLFAIDFGFENGKPFIYELNDQIGFPRPEMLKNSLVQSLANLLLEKSRL